MSPSLLLLSVFQYQHLQPHYPRYAEASKQVILIYSFFETFIGKAIALPHQKARSHPKFSRLQEFEIPQPQR